MNYRYATQPKLFIFRIKCINCTAILNIKRNIIGKRCRDINYKTMRSLKLIILFDHTR